MTEEIVSTIQKQIKNILFQKERRHDRRNLKTEINTEFMEDKKFKNII